MSLDPQPLDAVDAALVEAGAAGWVTVRLDLGGVRGKAGLMRRCADALRVPGWFGGNWDALADALIDLSWLPGAPEAPGRVVAVTSWSEFAGGRAGEWETFQEVLESAVEFWREDGGTPLVVLLADADPSGGRVRGGE
ncbi:barstar family protein [Streptomyces sp. NBC_01565]|uniref:barstar family protein n=1 Tax=unclassified Streptomyces TaxID=2593676 RepID=UPI00225138A8|nr:barstar family protein [Streptomyces sp. NBC_01565]MCX4544682.1 barstar family protein [Streptomyces sp. NBC_01565]